jgi:LPS-assembly protein
VADCGCLSRVLGSVFFSGLLQAMLNATLWRFIRRYALLAAFPTLLLPLLLAPSPVRAQTPAKTASKGLQKPRQADGEAVLSAIEQRWESGKYYGDGDVDVRYQNSRLRADHVEYDTETEVVIARGNVQLDYETQHVVADDARYEVRTGRGTFHHVRATIALQRRPQPTLLVSDNPLYFEAEEVERLSENSYRLRHAWLTGCDPARPTWKFYAPEATIVLQKSVHLQNGNFRLLSVPVLYLPYATLPAEKQRTSGFMIPEIGDSSRKGFILGDSLYWAPSDWMDATLGANYFSKRGWSQRAELRMKPWENATLTATYFGVLDRGLEQPDAAPINQGGHEERLLFTALFGDGWRAVADLDQLSSLTFRLAWAETFTQAVNSEVRNTAFIQNDFRGFSFSVAALSYENFLSASTATTAATSITLRSAPEVQFSSVDQAPFHHIPLYFSFDAFTGAVDRNENVTSFSTPNFVSRSEFAPTVTMPFHWGPWLDVAPSFTFRSTYYGGQLAATGAFVGQGVFRNTEEFSLDLRPPSFDRVWSSDGSDTRWKHVIEPELTYNYVNGVNGFPRFIRFDEDDTLTDTNEIQYGVTQRLFRREGSDGAQELVTLRLSQKYFFDPTFGGALVPGQRNVFQALDSLTPFAFADRSEPFSPIVSDLRIEPGKHFDTQLIVDYDTRRNRLTAIGTLLKLKPYKESFLTLAHFSTLNLPDNPKPPPVNFEQRSNQVRALLGYGDLNRKGFNATIGVSYDFAQDVFQNQIVQVGYNGSCCGLGFEYRKFSFGQIRNENQYLVVFRIANLGSVGTLRRQEKIF